MPFQTSFKRHSIATLLAAASALLCLCAPVEAQVQTLDRIVAVVNDGIVLQSELDRETANARTQLHSRDIPLPDEGILRSQVLEKLVMTRVQTQRADKSGIRVDDRELNEVLSGIAKQNKMTLAEFAELIRESGGDFLSVREQVRDEVTISRLRQREVDNRVAVTDQDIDLFLAGHPEQDDSEYRLSHILVAIPDGASPDQRAAAHQKAEGLRQKLVDGANFATLAASSSDGQQALQGGDLDWRKSDALPLVFLQAARKLKPGENSPLLETAGGYHIIRLVETRGTADRQTVTETRARHILLQNNAIRTEEQSQAQARLLHDQITKGGDFAKLAMEFSDDTGSKAAGGDMGWQPPGLFVQEFQDQLDALEPGQTTLPFRTQFGWHVAEVLERRSRDITAESRRARARGAIQQRKAAEEYDGWLRRLKAEAYVELRGVETAAPLPVPSAAPAPAVEAPAS